MSDINTILENKLNKLDHLDTNITGGTGGKITYPFIFVDAITSVELHAIQHDLKPGDVPLMVRDGNKYIRVMLTNIDLQLVKVLSRFSEKSIWIKRSKNEVVPIEKVIDYMLLEEDGDNEQEEA